MLTLDLDLTGKKWWYCILPNQTYRNAGSMKSMIIVCHSRIIIHSLSDCDVQDCGIIQKSISSNELYFLYLPMLHLRHVFYCPVFGLRREGKINDYCLMWFVVIKPRNLNSFINVMNLFVICSVCHWFILISIIFHSSYNKGIQNNI